MTRKVAAADPDLHIAFVNQVFGPTFTGRGLQLRTVAGELAARGIRIDILTESLPGVPARERLEEDAFTVHRVPLDEHDNPVVEWWRRRTAIRRLRELGPDVLHVYGHPSGIEPVIVAAKLLGVPTVISPTLLGSDDLPSIRDDGRLGPLRLAALRVADHFVAICPAIEDTFREVEVPRERVTHIPNAVDVERFRPQREGDETPGDLGLATEAPRALFVGSIVRRKGVDVLLEAWRRVTEKLPKARLYLAGPMGGGGTDDASEFVRACRGLVERHSMGDNVRFLGRQRSMAPLYRVVHTVLFPSRREGFPNVLLEAMASGTPPVTARIPGSTDVSVQDGRTGYVVPQEDPEALADRALTLLRDADTRRRMARAARTRAVERYALPTIADEHVKLYRRLAGVDGLAPAPRPTEGARSP